ANLEGANLEGANLESADLKNISWDNRTNWEGVKNLDKARNIPEDLKNELSD
ncbi:MAG: pentapeptide repeat-containing protein, partial [Cyanobacteria bacterium P01_E01_bin.42]